LATVVSRTPAELYQEMKQHDFGPVRRTLIRDAHFSPEKADDMIDAFCQWFSLVGSVEPGKVFVMLKGDIDEVFHAGVLNSAWYRGFCGTYLGEFIDHTPMDDDTFGKLDDAVLYTLAKLEATYGDSLHPALREWRHLVETANYEVSCGKGCPDDMAPTVVGHLPSGATIVH